MLVASRIVCRMRSLILGFGVPLFLGAGVLKEPVQLHDLCIVIMYLRLGVWGFKALGQCLIWALEYHTLIHFWDLLIKGNQL